MYRGYRFLGSLILTTTLAVPVALVCTAVAQENQEHKDANDSRRYYDTDHKDYHSWDADEQRAFQRYQLEHHERRAFAELTSHEQEAYWNWRHDHPDAHDDHRDRDRDDK